MALAEHPRFGKVWPGVLEAVNLIGLQAGAGTRLRGLDNLCNGSPAGDSVPAMIAAGAIVTVQGPSARTAAARSRWKTCPARPTAATHLLPGGNPCQFCAPAAAAGFGSDAYLRMIPRTEMDIAVVGVGVSRR